MSEAIGYSARREDLYTPGKNASFFSAGIPRTEAALCAEMARLAYCRNPESLEFDRERIQTILKSVDFPSCEFFENGGSHCFFAHGKDGVSVVSFRGTDADDPADLRYDVDLILSPWKNGRVHQGFARALGAIQVDLENALRSVEGRVLYTGHSLGAAMATLLASVQPPDLLYTFGSPRVGDADFVQSLSSINNHRYVDCCDAVTRVPPEFLGYVHLGDPHYIDSTRHVIENPDAEFVAADQSRARRHYLVEYAWRQGNVAARDLADHAPINYVMPTQAA